MSEARIDLTVASEEVGNLASQGEIPSPTNPTLSTTVPSNTALLAQIAREREKRILNKRIETLATKAKTASSYIEKKSSILGSKIESSLAKTKQEDLPARAENIKQQATSILDTSIANILSNLETVQEEALAKQQPEAASKAKKAIEDLVAKRNQLLGNIVSKVDIATVFADNEKTLKRQNDLLERDNKDRQRKTKQAERKQELENAKRKKIRDSEELDLESRIQAYESASQVLSKLGPPLNEKEFEQFKRQAAKEYEVVRKSVVRQAKLTGKIPYKGGREPVTATIQQNPPTPTAPPTSVPSSSTLPPTPPTPPSTPPVPPTPPTPPSGQTTTQPVPPPQPTTPPTPPPVPPRPPQPPQPPVPSPPNNPNPPPSNNFSNLINLLSQDTLGLLLLKHVKEFADLAKSSLDEAKKALVEGSTAEGLNTPRAFSGAGKVAKDAQVATSSAVGAIGGAAIGTAIAPGPGTLIGAGIGGTAGSLLGEILPSPTAIFLDMVGFLSEIAENTSMQARQFSPELIVSGINSQLRTLEHNVVRAYQIGGVLAQIENGQTELNMALARAVDRIIEVFGPLLAPILEHLALLINTVVKITEIDPKVLAREFAMAMFVPGGTAMAMFDIIRRGVAAALKEDKESSTISMDFAKELNNFLNPENVINRLPLNMRPQPI